MSATPVTSQDLSPPRAQKPVGSRLQALDIGRGAVMVLMALDHVRVYAGVPAGGSDPGVFFTRWITNFCAPAFFFLAGTGAFLHGERLGSRMALSRFLGTRGLWLVLLELTVLRVSWTFNLHFHDYLLAGVIWALGWCMVLLAVLVHLPRAWIATLGLAIVFGHNLTDLLLSSDAGSPVAWPWQILYRAGSFRLFGSGPRLVILYSLVPWIGVMALGYVFGPVLRLSADQRRSLCLRLGLGAIALFVLLRWSNLYGNPLPWGGERSQMPALLSFLNTAKYPASLLFLLMTLGPLLALLPWLEHAKGAAARGLAVFGRVPLFFYLLHIPLIHVAAVLISLVRSPEATDWLFTNQPMGAPRPPEGYTWSLPLLYAVTLLVVAALYFPCRWFARVKNERQSVWLTLL